jgi:hypothetical protein
MGRGPKLTPHQRRDCGETLRGIARDYDVHHSTVSRLKA